MKNENLLFVTRLEEHNKIKSDLLNLIDKCPSKNDGDDTGYHISKTDYYNDDEYTPDYWRFIRPYFEKNILKLITDNNIALNGFTITNFWFQQYFKNDLHSWHIHSTNHLANVYFVELPDDEVKTEIKNLYGVTIDYDAKEGDVITFPCFYYHRSPINKTNKRKTIIAYNIDLIT